MTQQSQDPQKAEGSALGGLGMLSALVLAWLMVTRALPADTMSWGFLAGFLLLGLLAVKR